MATINQVQVQVEASPPGLEAHNSKIDKKARLWQNDAQELLKCTLSILECGTLEDVGALLWFTALQKISTPEELLDSTEQLRTLKRTLSLLQALSTSLQVTIDDVSKKPSVAPPRLQFTNIPNEILSNIFEFVIDDSDFHYACNTAVRLSSVCRRFRSVALSDPYIWRNISNAYPITTALPVLLQRSKAVPLAISLYACFHEQDAHTPPSQYWEKFFKIIRGRSHQWKEVIFYCFECDTLPNVLFDTLHRECTQLALPNLQAIRLSQNPKVVSVVRNDTEKLNFRDWLTRVFADAPKLSQLDMHCFIPEKSIAHRLTSFSVSNHGWLEMSKIDLSDLFAFLSAAQNLKDLKLILDCEEDDIFEEFRDDDSTASVYVSKFPLPAVRLPKLESFVLYSQNNREHFVTAMFESLYFPNVKTMALSLRGLAVHSRDDYADFFDILCVDRGEQVFSHLERLSLAIGHRVHKHPVKRHRVYSAYLFDYFPSLQHLYLELDPTNYEFSWTSPEYDFEQKTWIVYMLDNGGYVDTRSEEEEARNGCDAKKIIRECMLEDASSSTKELDVALGDNYREVIVGGRVILRSGGMPTSRFNYSLDANGIDDTNWILPRSLTS